METTQQPIESSGFAIAKSSLSRKYGVNAVDVLSCRSFGDLPYVATITRSDCHEGEANNRGLETTKGIVSKKSICKTHVEGLWSYPNDFPSVEDFKTMERQHFSSSIPTVLDNARDEIENLKDELQEWYDNLPESFQYGMKGEALEEAINILEQGYDELDPLVEFVNTKVEEERQAEMKGELIRDFYTPSTSEGYSLRSTDVVVIPNKLSRKDSRSGRLAQVILSLQAIADFIARPGVNIDESYDAADNAIMELEAVEFPSMF